MKTTLWLIFFSLSFQIGYSQDIIIKKDGDKIKATVVEVGLDEVKYKKYETSDGPIYLIMKSDIFMIEYDNGDKDIFNNEKPSQNQQETQIQDQEQETTIRKNETGSRSSAVRVGFIIGFTLANLASEPSGNTNARPGLQAGLGLEIPFSPQISMQTGLLFTQRGLRNSAEVTEFGETYESKLKFNLSYLDIPFNAKFNFDAGNISIYGLSGVYLGYGLRGSIVEDRLLPSGEPFEDSELIGWGFDLKRLDYGLNFGAGAQFNSFQVGIYYSLGLAKCFSIC